MNITRNAERSSPISPLTSFEVEVVLSDKLWNGDVFNKRLGASRQSGHGVTNGHTNRLVTDYV